MCARCLVNVKWTLSDALDSISRPDAILPCRQSFPYIPASGALIKWAAAQSPPVRPLTACTTHHTNCRLSDGQPFHCLIVGYNTTRVVANAWRSPLWLVWRDGVLACWRGGVSARWCAAGGAAAWRRRPCRAPGHAPPSRTTRTDTWCTGPDMSWERDVRVHTIPLTLEFPSCHFTRLTHLDIYILTQHWHTHNIWLTHKYT